MLKKGCLIATMILLIVLFQRCNKNDNNQGGGAAIRNLVALPALASSPANNPQELQKITLGKQLFWDPILSGNKDVACASCHHPSFAYTDNLDIAIGVNGTGLGGGRHFIPSAGMLFTKRNSPTIVDAAFNGMDASGNCNPLTAPMFFDNRKQSLEMQSLEPIKALEEMRGTIFTEINALDSVVARVKNIAEYQTLFQNVFPSPNPVTADNIAEAIASFERTIISTNSSFDKYARGQLTAMSQTQIQGLNAFIRVGCATCHSGPMFSDYQLHILSVPDNSKIPTDAGANGTYAFRTPSLRNLSFTAPYMHNGVFQTLDQVLSFYDQLGDGRSQNPHVPNNQLDSKLRGVNDRDRGLIIEFLKALDDNTFDKSIPARVPSNLHPGGNI